MTTESPSERQPSYRDAQLQVLMRQLRASVQTVPQAKATLARVEQRLRYVLRVIELWDKSHAKRAEDLIRLGNLPAANTAAALIFDPDLRASIYRRTPIGYDGSSEERVALALEMDREVLD